MDWHKKALEYRCQGLSSRKVCRKLGWETTRKSTVNYFFSDYDKGLYEEYSTPLETKKPKILFWDLESSLMQGYFFGLWKQNIPMSRVTKQTHLLSASYAFNDGEVVGMRLTPENVKTGDDLEIVVKMIQAINEADAIVTFNGKKFDVKLLNTRALFWGLPPVRPVKHIDLMEQAKRNFKFPSNSMQNISMYLGEDGKISTSGSRLWERCSEYQNYEECDKALETMLLYGNQDILATRDLYKRFQGWMKNTPNIGTITNDVSGNTTLRCVHCGSDDIQSIEKNAYTAVSAFSLYRCGNTDCRGVSRISSNGKNLLGVI